MDDFDIKVYGGSERVVFFFCAFGVPGWQFYLPGLPVWRLVRAGYQVVVYSYDRTIATISAGESVRRMELVLEDASRRLDAYAAQGKHWFATFGVSMGTVLANNLAARRPEIIKLVLNLSYSNIADHIINLPVIPTVSTEKLRSYITASGGAVAVRQTFDYLSPIRLTDKLAGKDILLYLAKRDRLLQWRHTAALVPALRAVACRFEYAEEPQLGHYFAALRNNVRGRRYLDFLAAS